MKFTVKRHALALTCGFTLLTSTLQIASAHGIYATQRQSEIVYIYGHGPSDETFPAEKFKGAFSYKNGKSSKLNVKFKNSYPALPSDEKLGLVTAIFDNGYWSQKADGEWENKPKTEVADVKKSGHYMKYTTTILNKEVKAGQVTGLPLEIVPLVNPLTLKQGDTLQIQVYANSKPVADIELVTEFVTDSENIVKTNAEGIAEITIRSSGLNVFATEVSEELEDKTKADKLGKFATFSFTFPADH